MTNEGLEIVRMAYSKPSIQACRYCNDTGKIEVIVYEGRPIAGILQPGHSFLGYDRFFQTVWTYYQSLDSSIGDCETYDERTERALLRVKENYDPLRYYRVKGIIDCQYCRRDA
ncbi:MAG: hypothetical protein ACO23V_08190 [Chitinophagaceae bacterium]